MTDNSTEKRIPYIDRHGVFMVKETCLYNNVQMYKDIIHTNNDLKTKNGLLEEKVEELEKRLYYMSLIGAFILVSVLFMLGN